MLHVVTGLFHPELEQSLASDLRSLKADHPFSPCLILVPSESLRTYLKWTLCVERGQPLFNVQVLTFHQLALRVLEERDRRPSSRLRSGAFFREWVHHLLRKRGTDPVGLEGLASMPGACAALWGTLNDFKNARVDPESIEAALSHGPFSEDRRLQSIICLYRAFLDVRSDGSWYDHEDLAVLAADLVPESSFLQQQAHVFYYGFYDLTQVQLDVFHAVVRQYPTTLYFPLLDKHPAFRFAQQFFDQHVLGVATGSIERRVGAMHRSPFMSLFDPSGEFGTSEATSRAETAVPESTSSDRQESVVPRLTQPAETQRVCRLVTVSGVHDEIEVVAKEIRAVVQEGRVAFRDVGVVGRTMAGYTDLIPRIFHEQGVPFHSTLHRPLTRHPFPKTFLSLLHLRQSDLDRQTTFDVLHSSFLHWKVFCPEIRTPRPELWEQASRQLGIDKGMHEWERLDDHVETGVMLKQKRRRADTVIPGREIHNLRQVIRRLDQLLQEFPERASWEAFADRTLSLMDSAFTVGERNVGVTPDEMEGGSEPSRIAQAVVECVMEIRGLAHTNEEVPYAEFLATLNRLMEERAVPVHTTMENGVWVGDAMAARGLSFRFVFVIGLTDHLFPRHVQEDPFLRDSVRRVLETDFGFKVEEKAKGHDEEKLLFFLLVHAARERITLVVQRSDEEGRATIPSWYLQEVQRCRPGLAPVDVPRSVLQKFQTPQTDAYAVERRWTPRERLVQNLLQRRWPNRSTEETEAWWRILQQGLKTLRAQESHHRRLNACDGITGHLTDYWQWLHGHGLSPTSLEHYVTCPFQYFARDVLELQAADETKTTEDVQPVEIGTLVHEIIKGWYARLSEQEWFKRPDSSDLPYRVLKEVAESVFREFERTHSVGPALLWEMQQERLAGILERILRQDLNEMDHTWIPVTFEQRLEGTMTVNTASAATTFPITGCPDRIDWSPTTRRYRVIDYKYTSRTTGLMTEKSLAREVVRGTRLQPVMYMELAGQGVPQLLPDEHKSDGAPATCDGVWLYFVAPGALEEGEGFAPVPFLSATRDRLQPQLDKTMTTIIEGIRGGNFFLVKGEHCTWCEVRSVCHRNHQGSARRAREDSERTRDHRTVRRQKADWIPD